MTNRAAIIAYTLNAFLLALAVYIHDDGRYNAMAVFIGACALVSFALAFYIEAKRGGVFNGAPYYAAIALTVVGYLLTLPYLV